ncbi:MAG TPA: OmpA family protein [Epsilonproteobacteria bacterium]|nr:OmpA family protein [Campylobacterota bacterium]
MKLFKPMLAATVAAFMLGGCYNQPGLVEDGSYNRTKTGALTGAIAGALIGYNTKGKHKNRRAAIGALAGAALGGGAGYLLDRQANEIARALGTGVDNDPLAALDPNRNIIVSKTDSYVKLMFRDKMMFATGSSKLQSRAKAKVNTVARLLRNYPQTIVGVAGFTDNRGSYAYNQGLSQRRAATVGNLLAVNGRPYTKGCSYSKAIAPNDSARNRALNRRVEVYLYQDRNLMSDPCN